MNKYFRVIVLLLVDAIAFNLSYILSFLIRFEFDIHDAMFLSHFSSYLDNIISLTLIKIVIFFAFGMYKKLWKYADSEDMVKVIAASMAASATAVVFLALIQQQPIMPRSIYVLSFIFDTIFVLFIRSAIRYSTNKNKRGFFTGIMSVFSSRKNEGERYGPLRVMLVGAGSAGASIIQEIKSNPVQNRKVEVAIDDDPLKKGQQLSGVRIVGNRKDIILMARRHSIDEIIIALPAANKKQIQSIINECNKTKCLVKILPSLKDLIDNKVSVKALRDVNIEDLLGRDPVQLNIKDISSYLEGKIVMVTGGGGSIGSELCRQIAKYKPRKLIALDIYENGVFELTGELKASNPELEFDAVIGSVRDMPRMKEVFNRHKPHVVFHAAAHKHVPLMEKNPGEAVNNNIIGTKNVAELSDVFAAEKFILISTDKAVNPTNVMGATKRIAEMIVNEKGRHSHTEYTVVRFGNVLDSNGSVLPIFRKQIEKGGPVTVTDKDITRYFMTIPEAVQLVIQAGAIAVGGEIFILDMGEPVKILDLAENIVKLSGYKPYEDIDIVITELRPGEKLHEELSYESEMFKKTSHDKIFLGTASLASPTLSEALENEGALLEKSITTHVVGHSDADIKNWLQAVLPSYKLENEQSIFRGVIIDDSSNSSFKID